MQVSFANNFLVVDSGDVEFPYFSSKKYPKSAKNINKYLYLNHFDSETRVPKNYKEHLYAINSYYKGNDPSATTFYNYYYMERKNTILIKINLKGCGAYCENHTSRKNFLQKSGDLIKIKSIFTAKGLKKIENILRKRISIKINTFLKYKERYQKEDKDIYFFSKNDIYQRCLVDNSEYSELSKYVEYMEYVPFEIYDNSIIFYQGRCTNHGMRALDELSDYKMILSLKEIYPHLSDFGKSLFPQKSLNLESKK